jgi:hypothetical protein
LKPKTPATEQIQTYALDRKATRISPSKSNIISVKSHTTKQNHLKETKTILKQAMKYITLAQT